MSADKQLYLLGSRRFLPVFIVQFLGAVNDNIFKNAIVILITYTLSKQLPMSTESSVALAGGLFILPFFLFSAIAGQLADKFPKNKLIQYVKASEVIIMSFGALTLYYQDAIWLLSVLFLMGAQSAFFGPLKYGILPEHLRKSELLFGNALVEAATYIAILLGTVVGGSFILKTNGIQFTAALVVIIAAVGYLFSRYIPSATPANPSGKINLNLFAEIYKVSKYAYSKTRIFRLIIGISWFWFLGATLLTIIPPYVKDVLYGDEDVVVLFMMLFSIGIGVGSLLCARIQYGELTAKFVPLSGIGMSAAILLFIWVNGKVTEPMPDLHLFYSTFHGFVISLSLFSIAVFGGIFSVPLYTLLQAWSDPTHVARNIATNNIFNSLFMVASALMALLIYAVGGDIFTVLKVLAVLNFFFAIYTVSIIPEGITHTVFRFFIKLLYNVKVEGLEHFEAAGKRVVIISNHVSLIDPILLTSLLPGRITFAIDTAWRKQWWMRLILWANETFPIDPMNSMGIKKIVQTVKADKRVVIFPEGRITTTGSLMKVYEGPGLVAEKADAKILPIFIQGAQFTPFSYLKGKLKLSLFPTITIRIHPPLAVETDPSLSPKKARQARANQLYRTMTSMSIQAFSPKRTLFKTLLDAASTHGYRSKIIEGTQFVPISYATLIARAFVLGKVINKRTPPPQNIGMLLPNSTAAVTTFFAIQSLHRTPAILNFTAGPKNILSACKTAQVTHIYSSHEFVEKANLSPVIDTLEENNITIHYLEDMKGEAKKCVWTYAMAYAAPQLLYNARLPKNTNKDLFEDPAAILFTSGTSGAPKGVVLSHKNLNTNRAQVLSVIDFTSNDTMFNALPFFHAFGLTAGTLVPILSGVPVFLYPTPLHYTTIPELVYMKNATILLGTNTFLQGYAKKAHPYDFHALRYVFAGAEKVQQSTINLYAKEFGVRILEGYGATETSPVLSINTPMYHKHDSVGQLLPGIDARLEPVPGIKEGQNLFVRGDNIMLGYMKPENPGVLIPQMNDWYDTGDIVNIDDDAFIYIVGRAKRFAKIGGEMISLGAVEALAFELWPNNFHAAIAVPHPSKGEQLILVTDHKDADAASLRQHAKHIGQPEILVPKQITHMKEIPKLGSGKPNYVELEEGCRGKI